MNGRFGLLASILAVVLSVSAAGQAPISPEDARHRAIFKELIETNTSPMGGNVSRASRAIRTRLLAAGYGPRDAQVIGPAPTCLNVIATLRGRDARLKPVLLMAHIDVVPARRSDWKFDPYALREENGMFYGRGALDNKAGASVLVANMVRWKREGFVPARDVIMVLTCDEETTAEQGIVWLLKNVPRLREADYALNTDAGDVSPSSSGRPVFSLQAAEKTYVTFEVTARNPGGHSSVPRRDNAIYALARALARIQDHVFPVQYNSVSQASFARGAELETGQLADDMRAAGRGETSGPAIDRLLAIPYLGAGLHTTCVATMLTGGHAENALPQSASATVNCRMMPGTAAADVQRVLTSVAADTSVKVSMIYTPTPSDASPLRADVMPTIEQLAAEFWPNSAVVPGMSNGATDGLYLRNAGVPVFGVSGIFILPDDDRSHGLDERVPVESLYKSREFWYRMVKTLATTTPGIAMHTPSGSR